MSESYCRWIEMDGTERICAHYIRSCNSCIHPKVGLDRTIDMKYASILSCDHFEFECSEICAETSEL